MSLKAHQEGRLYINNNSVFKITLALNYILSALNQPPAPGPFYIPSYLRLLIWYPGYHGFQVETLVIVIGRKLSTT